MVGGMVLETIPLTWDLTHIFKLIFFIKDEDFIEDHSYIRIKTV